MQPSTQFLSNQEFVKRLNALVGAIKKVYNPKHWNDPEEFEKSFFMKTWEVEAEFRSLREAFTFSQKVKWYEQGKKRAVRKH